MASTWAHTKSYVGGAIPHLCLKLKLNTSDFILWSILETETIHSDEATFPSFLLLQNDIPLWNHLVI